jgi:hypothetical protein
MASKIALKRLAVLFISVTIAACAVPKVDTGDALTELPLAIPTHSQGFNTYQAQTPPTLTAPPESDVSHDLPTPECTAHQADLQLLASTSSMMVGESLTLTATLTNSGCAMLGLPKYSFSGMADGDAYLVQPTELEPIIHSVALRDGEHDEAYFTLKAVAPGKAELKVSASFEVHLGYPGPAYWATAASQPVIIEIGE